MTKPLFYTRFILFFLANAHIQIQANKRFQQNPENLISKRVDVHLYGALFLREFVLKDLAQSSSHFWVNAFNLSSI